MRSVRAVGLLAVGVVVAMGGCSGEEPGTPVTPTAGESSSGSGSSSEVPSVANPLDISPFLENPCELVPRSAVSDLGYAEPGEPLTAEDSSAAALSGPGCVWGEQDSIRGIQLGIQTGNRKNGVGGLQGLYDAYQSGQYVYWEPTTVAGYPAAFLDAVDLRDRGTCSLSVGIADDLSFSVSGNGYTKQPTQACPDAKMVAEQVIATLKGGS